MAAVSKGVTLYTSGTPNGWKASILLKELKYPHKVHPISLSKSEQKEDWFVKINPNGRIPAIVDHDNDDFPVFESGAILMYLAEKAGQFYPSDPKKRADVNQWLFFQNAGLGPMQGQANHFVRYAPEKIEYGINRYTNEAKRLYGVMDAHLKDHQFLAADEYTIADISTYGWVFAAPWAGLSLDDFPNVKGWFERISERPAVQEGLDVPEPNKMRDIMADPETMKKTIQDAQAMMVSAKAEK